LPGALLVDRKGGRAGVSVITATHPPTHQRDVKFCGTFTAGISNKVRKTFEVDDESQLIFFM